MSQIPTGTVYPGQPAPKKKRTGLVVGLVLGGVALFALCGFGGCAALLSNASDPSPSTSPAASAPADPNGADSPTDAPSPSESAKLKVLLRLDGSGIKKTTEFTTGDHWTLSYSYNCSNFGSQGNFAVTEYTDGAMTDVLVNELDAKGSASTPVYDGGQHYLEINSECDWSVRVTG